MTDPDQYVAIAAEMSIGLLRVKDKLLNAYKDEPEVRQLLGLDRPSLTGYELTRALFDIKQGTYERADVEEVFALADTHLGNAWELYNKLHLQSLNSNQQQDSTPGEPAADPWAFLSGPKK